MIWNFVFFLNSLSPKSSSLHNNIKLIDSRSASALNLRFAQWSDVENSSCRRDSGYDFTSCLCSFWEERAKKTILKWVVLIPSPQKRRQSTYSASKNAGGKADVTHFDACHIAQPPHHLFTCLCRRMLLRLLSKKLNSSSMFVFHDLLSLCYVLHCFNQETIRHTWVGEGRDILNKAGESE